MQDAVGTKLDQSSVVESLKPWTSYQFLGLFKKQSHKTKSWQLNAHIAAKVYLRRLSVIWSSHLLDINCVRARKQFAMIVQTYLRWSQQLPNTELWAIDREATKIICEEGGKHLLSSTLVTHLVREGRAWVALR